MTSISEKNKLQPHFMDRHKQQIKRDRQDLKRRAINSQNKSRMRTLIKNVLSSDSKKAADEYYSSAVSFIDKMASKNIIHKNLSLIHI